MEKEKITDILKKNFSDKIEEVRIEFGDEIAVIEKKSLLEVAKFLKNAPYSFTLLLDLTCVDYQDEDWRYEMVYHFFSLERNQKVRIKARLPKKNPGIESLTSLWKNANWLEREVYDMFGIHFEGHPDLRRLFMYDGFEGHPLRKDYPLRKRQPQIPMREDNAD